MARSRSNQWEHVRYHVKVMAQDWQDAIDCNASEYSRRRDWHSDRYEAVDQLKPKTLEARRAGKIITAPLQKVGAC